jgi:hypothetical protein
MNILDTRGLVEFLRADHSPYELEYQLEQEQVRREELAEYCIPEGKWGRWLVAAEKQAIIADYERTVAHYEQYCECVAIARALKSDDEWMDDSRTRADLSSSVAKLPIMLQCLVLEDIQAYFEGTSTRLRERTLRQRVHTPPPSRTMRDSMMLRIHRLFDRVL